MPLRHDWTQIYLVNYHKKRYAQMHNGLFIQYKYKETIIQSTKTCKKLKKKKVDQLKIHKGYKNITKDILVFAVASIAANDQL